MSYIAPKFDESIEGFDALTQDGIKKFLDLDICPTIEVCGNDVKVCVDKSPSYKETLILKNVDSVPEINQSQCFRNMEFYYSEFDSTYNIDGEIENYITDEVLPFSLSFEDATAEVQVFNGCRSITILDNPWDYLGRICYGIYSKASLPCECLGSKEKALLPLIAELASFDHWLFIPADAPEKYNEMKALARKHGHRKVEAALERLESTTTGTPKYYKLYSKLTALLSQRKHASMWRDIYDRIAESQEEYPSSIEQRFSSEELTKTRAEIQSLMEAKGYIGTYPDFVKDGCLRGPCLERSYNLTYIVAMEKHAEFHIHCIETVDEDDCLGIQLLCGTAFLKKNEAEAGVDIYDCLFNAGGRRLFRTVYYSGDLEEAVTIATKKAECVKLNEEERKAFYGTGTNGWSTFWWLFLVAGGMCGISFTLIAMLLCTGLTLAFGMLSSIPEMLSTIPWGLILAICWVGSGGALGLFEVLARRK